MDFELNNKEPIYLQIKNSIEAKIISGELKGGDKMLSVREYANLISVNPNTIQRAYSELEREELVVTQRGIGKFITTDEKILQDLKFKKSEDIFKSFLATVKNLGFEKEDIINMINKYF